MSRPGQLKAASARRRERGDSDHGATIIAAQEDIDAAVARAESATPLGIRATSPGGLRLLNGKVYVVAGFGPQDKYRAALARELALVDPRLTVADVDLTPGDAPQQAQLDALLAEAMTSHQVAGCRCTPQPVATRTGRQVWVGQAHGASCPLTVFLLKRLGLLGLTLAERPTDPEGTGYVGHLDNDNPTPPSDQKFTEWDGLSEALQHETARFGRGATVKIGSSPSGVGLYTVVPNDLTILDDIGGTNDF